MKPCKVYVGGVGYRAGNIGDDAILRAILYILTRAAPNVEITVGTYDGKKPQGLLCDVTVVHWREFQQVTKAIRECDCSIIGGATVIGDELGLYYPLEYIAKLVSTAKFHGKKTAMLAIGANKLRSAKGEKMAREIVRLCDIITLRDEGSREVCLSLGANPSRTVATADAAFLLEPQETARTKELKERLRRRGRVLGVNVVNEVWSGEERYKAAIARACDELASRHGYLPVFFCNEVRSGAEYDFEANTRTAAYLHCDHEVLEPVYYSPEEMIDLISCFDCVLAMRMHALIFAAITGVPFVSVARVDKVENFMRLFGRRASGTVDDCDSGKIIAEVERLHAEGPALRKRVVGRVGVLRREFLRNVEVLRQLLSERRVLWRKASLCSLGFVLSEHRYCGRISRLLRGDVGFGEVMRKVGRACGCRGSG